jgi:FkbM family methyltransferase
MLNDYGEYQQKEIDMLLGILSNNVKNNIIVYDIGANIGYHTLAFSKHVRHVYSWEASPQNYKLLKMNTQGKIASNVTTFNTAIHNRETDAICIEEFDPSTTGNFGAVRVGVKGVGIQARFLDSYINEIVPPTCIKSSQRS